MAFDLSADPLGGREAGSQGQECGVCLLPAAPQAFLLADLQNSQEGAVLALFSKGEASVHAGTLYPSFFLSGNLSPGCLLNAIESVPVKPQQPHCSNSCFSTVNSEMKFLQHHSLYSSVAVWDKHVLFILHMAPLPE